MRKCRIGKRMANHYRNYADMFEKMSLLDIVSWTIGVVVISTAAGWAAGKIAKYTVDKIEAYNNIGTIDPNAEKHTDDE